jgi:hypothetical protein
MILSAMTLRLDLLVAVVVVAGLVATAAAWRQWRLPLWWTLAVALGVRIVVAFLARPITPLDVAMVFENVGLEVLAGRDPTLSLAYHQWNFLPLMPFVYAGLTKTGLAWVDAVKVLPIAADVASVYLIGLLAPAGMAATRRLVYALHPVVLLTTSLHGQVEPIALALLLGGMVLFKRHRDLAAGTAFGFAITAKTWPVLVVLPIIWRHPRRLLKVGIPIAIVGAAFYASSVLFLGSNPVDLAKALTSYGSFAGFWGWAGSLHAFGDLRVFAYDSWVSTPGSILVLLSVAAAMVLFRNASMLRRAWTTPMASLVLSAGLGPQYLAWPVPMLTANGERQFAYSAASTVYMLVFYLTFTEADLYLHFISGLSFMVIAAMLQLLWRAARDEYTRGTSEVLLTATGDPAEPADDPA